MSELTVAQRRALTAEGDVLVAAAAGSGKTRVLTGRIVRALTEQGVGLDGIVAVTFTDKAAHEIRNRVARSCIELGRTDLVAGLETAMIGTIHSLCGRLLRRYGASVGIDPGFSVLNATHAAWLRRRAMEDALEQLSSGSDGAMRIRARYGDERLIALALAALEAASQRPGRGLRWAGDADADARMLGELVAEGQRRYDAACRVAGGLDYEGMQHGALAALMIDDVRLDVQSRIQRVLVDEFQDTNSLQCAVLDAIGAGCTFVVGDEWQSMYRFRSADVTVFRGRADSMGTVPMRDNFRSACPVLELVNGLFGRVFGERYDPVLVGRSDAMGVRCRMLLAAPPAGDERRLEAALVADEIASLVRDGVDPSKIAVLVAGQTHARTFEQALEQRGVSSLRSASRGYYDQQDVADVTSLLAAVRNPRDDQAMVEVLAGPIGRIGPRELLELRVRAASAVTSSLPATVWDAVLESAGDGDVSCLRVVDLIGELVRRMRDGSLVDLVEHAVHGSGIAERVLSRHDGRRRYANLRKLVELADAAESAGLRDPGRYLDLVGSQSIRVAEGDATLADESAGSVRILTVHASKGLEFDHVFVVDTSNRGSNAHPRLLVADDGCVAFEHVDAEGVAMIVPDELEQLRAADAAAGREEMQRLMYVALTRAREQLTITGTLSTKSSGDLAATGPLSWMLEALDITPTVGSTSHPEMPLDVEVCDAAGVPVMAAKPVEQQQDVTIPNVFEPTDPTVGPAPLVTEAEDAVIDEEATADGVVLHQWLAEAIQLAVRTGSPHPQPPATDDERLPQHLRARARGLALSPLLAELVSAGARVEVPWTADGSGAARDAGRFDCLAVMDDGTWWIHDHKLSLPAAADDAWRVHGEQLERYAAAARRGGATCVRMTLQSASDPSIVHEFRR